jgi:hypothetical protein
MNEAEYMHTSGEDLWKENISEININRIILKWFF